ncbi:MAG: hypothetical protein QNJ72_08595 [Pleurocapsa sp. MO_226.B13]|nr:hypothetical protein [Pleurocapsa sp. MO_226.B13]
MRLNGVSLALRNRLKPPDVTTPPSPPVMLSSCSKIEWLKLRRLTSLSFVSIDMWLSVFHGNTLSFSQSVRSRFV